MYLTKEQREIGTQNFLHVLGELRGEFLRDSLRASQIGNFYFSYPKPTGKPVRVGIVGVGGEGREALIMQSPPEYLQFVAFHDIRPSQIALTPKYFSTLYGAEEAKKIKFHDKWEDLLADKNVEAILIATPLWTHARLAIDAMKAGKHVLCEKLMAHNVTEAKQMVRVADETKRVLSIGHQRHYSPLYDHAMFLVHSGVLGEIRHIRALWHRNNTWFKPDAEGKDSQEMHDGWKPDIPDADQSIDYARHGYRNLNELVRWRLFDRTGGGLMAELGSHQLDACSLFLKKVHPLQVNAIGGKHFYRDERECEDHVYCMYEMPGNVVMTYSSINTNALEGYGEIVIGTKGTFLILNERDVMLFKERSATDSIPAPDMHVKLAVDPKTGGFRADQSGKPILTAGEGWAISKSAALAKLALEHAVSFTPVGKKTAMVDRGYRGEMEAFACAVRDPSIKVRCDGRIALADTVMALAANSALRTGGRLKFTNDWYDPASPAVPDHRSAGSVAKQ